MSLGMEVDPRLGPGEFVFDEDPAPSQRKAQPHPIFGPCLLWPNGWIGQTAGWMKTPLGTKVDLGPGHIMLDGDPAPPRKGTAAFPFSAHVSCGHGRSSQLLLSSCSISELRS